MPTRPRYPDIIMKILNNRHLGIAMVYILTVSVAYGITSHLNTPRISDKVTMYRLKTGPHQSSATPKILDLTSIFIEQREMMSIWEPAPDDSLSDMNIMIGRELKHIVRKPEGLFCHKEQKPGYSRQYNNMIPYIVFQAHNRSPYHVTSSGHAGNMSDYHTTGTCAVTAHPDFDIVISNNDTLHNVECLEISLRDVLAFNDTLRNNHESHVRQWYAPGYRYPVLTQRMDILFTEQGDTLDYDSVWEMIAPDCQENEITDDTVNEEIRHMVTDQHHYLPPDTDKGNRPNKYATPPYINWNNPDEIIVTDIFSSDAFRSIILCDIHGRVYLFHEFSDLERSIPVSVSELPPGVYLICVETDGEPLTYRFRV